MRLLPKIHSQIYRTRIYITTDTYRYTFIVLVAAILAYVSIGLEFGATSGSEILVTISYYAYEKLPLSLAEYVTIAIKNRTITLKNSLD